MRFVSLFGRPTVAPARRSVRMLTALVGLAGLVAAGLAVEAGFVGGGFGGGRAVGGISISPEGVLTSVTPDARKAIRDAFAAEVTGPVKDAVAPVKMRMVSLRSIEEAMAKAGSDFEKLPEEVKYLAGLQRIQYVFVDAERHDLVLAGPAEGWKVGPTGDVVGITTGKPVVQLADLVMAFRTTEAARTEGITCSIDPTEEGRKNLRSLYSKTRQFSPALISAVQSALGPQQISLTGVPTDSHMARVLVAADYRLKRISMGLEPSPVKGIPSYLELVSRAGSAAPSETTPRWWMACNYEPLSRSEDGLSWEIRGPGVKVMTEDELISKDGKVAGTGKTSKIATTLANAFTENYESLTSREPIFGQLRNVMDACVVSALIDKHDLLGQAGLAIPTMLGKAKSDGKFQSYPAPKTVGTEVSFVTVSGATVITASGGVDVDSWSVVDQAPKTADLASARSQAVGGSSLWWNPVTR